MDRKIFKINKRRAISKRIFSLLNYSSRRESNALYFNAGTLFLLVSNKTYSVARNKYYFNYYAPSTWICLLVENQRDFLSVPEEILNCKYKSEIVYITYKHYVTEKKNAVSFITYKNLSKIS